ncbi:MAG: hypothetical protein JXQ23_13500 [Clostridia bacterium]|nr:hypothetical protein [Clostridia bacterium]
MTKKLALTLSVLMLMAAVSCDRINKNPDGITIIDEKTIVRRNEVLELDGVDPTIERFLKDPSNLIEFKFYDKKYFSYDDCSIDGDQGQSADDNIVTVEYELTGQDVLYGSPVRCSKELILNSRLYRGKATPPLFGFKTDK